MKDIKKLYLAAKQSGKSHDIDAYSECVREYLESNPFQYVSNLEYIISSSIGLSTLREFVDRNGISIGSYNEIMNCLTEGVKQCRLRSKNDKPYQEAVAMMESYKQQYQNCFIMFEAFKDKLDDRYTEAYYKNFPVLKGALAGQVNVARIISRFGESCVPDMLIYASKFGNPDVMLESLRSAYEQSFFDNIPLSYQWISESVKDIPETSSTIVESINVKSLGRIVESASSRNTALYRESVLTGDESIMQQYTESEIHAMEDLISFKEYQITCLENVDQIMDLQQQIYSLYETFEGLIEEDVATSVAPMLPGSQQKVTTNLAEASLGNTRNKKTGDIPDYLKRNHDISYGEEDPVKKPEEKTNDNHEPSLDDFKRPSAEEDHTKITPYDYSQDDNKSADVKSDDDDDVDSKKQHVNNHYYYTYTNSNNTNSNSFNRHNQDDHSTGKRVNSDDNINTAHRESTFWSIDDLQAQPLTELYHLPADYYNLYHEATSVLITEANAVAVELRDAPKEEEEKPGIIARMKAMMMKFLNFLIEAYERLFPKGFLAFSKLEAKFKKSEKLMKACKLNDNILKIMDLKIPHISGVSHAFHDLVQYVNSGKVPDKGMEMYQRHGTTQIAIYWGALTGKDGKGSDSIEHMCFRLASDSPTSQKSPMLGKNLARISTYLSEDNLLEAFGIRVNNQRGTKMTISDIIAVFKYTKIKINTSPDLWRNRDNRSKMLELLKALTDVTNSVYRTMNQAYKSAVLLLKNAEEGKFESVDVQLESAPWELDIFPKMELFQEIASPAQYFKEASALESRQNYWKAENKAMMDVAGNVLNKASKYFADNLEKVIKSQSKFKRIDNPKLISEIKSHGLNTIMSLGRSEVLVFDGMQDYNHMPEDGDSSGNYLIAECFNIMMKNIHKDMPELLKYFEIPLSSKGWVDAVDDIPGITFIIKEPDSSIKIKVGGTVLKFHTVARGNWIADKRVCNFKDLPASVLSFLINRDAIESDKMGIAKSIEGYINAAKSEFPEMDKLSLDEKLSKYIKADKIYFKSAGNIGLSFKSPIDSEHGFGINITPKLKVVSGQDDVAFESVMYEDVGDADDQKPSSDNPIQDTMTDLDRKLASTQQAAKKKVQGVVNTTRTIVKPFKRTAMWISNMVSNWKDANENDIKERLADPRSRSNLFTAIKTAIKYGSLLKAGLLLNPIILYLTLSKRWNRSSKEFRLRNEMIGELKAELEILTVKIQDADRAGDNKAKYQLMRFKNELNKKLIRVSGTEVIRKDLV